MSVESLKETDSFKYTPQRHYDTTPIPDDHVKNIEAGQQPAQKEKYPKIVFLIILNEFCERFSYYGLRTILFIYLTSFIHLESHTATAIYHSFTVLCYFSPLLGAIIADGYIGLYRTILYVSCLYCVGELVLTLTSIPALGAPNVIGPVIGLIIIAIGTGGIKPCVSAFGGNQFGPNQKKYLETFFSIFYLSINIGSTISTVITPIFRNDVKCFGHDCYALAFGVPAIAMFLSIVFFVAGTPFYKRDDEKSKNGKNVISETFKCVAVAVINKVRSRAEPVKKEHWLDYADHKFTPQLIADVKALFRILFVFLPLPIFWALYDQQGSRWTMQAQQLDGRMGSFTIKPDQFQAINPIIIVFVVPLFDFVIYPLFAKVNLLKRPLQRMCVGLVFGIAAFIIAAILESRMQASVAALNPTGRIRVLNLSPCKIQLDVNQTFLNIQESGELILDAGDRGLGFSDGRNQTLININSFCPGNVTSTNSVVIGSNNLPKNFIIFLENDRIRTSEYGYDNKQFVIGYSLVKYELFGLRSFGELKVNISNKNLNDFTVLNPDKLLENSIVFSDSSYKKVDYTDYDLWVQNENGSELVHAKLSFQTCASYSILFYPNPVDSKLLSYKILTDVYPNGLHIGWQLIQIFVMTIGEIMFSISGISFAYSQAPASMKSVIQAMWCMTVALGNLIVVIIAEGKFVESQVNEYYLFAGLLGAATIAFGVLTFFYKYKDEQDNQVGEEKQPGVDGVANVAFSKNSIDTDIKLLKLNSLETKEKIAKL